VLETNPRCRVGLERGLYVPVHGFVAAEQAGGRVGGAFSRRFKNSPIKRTKRRGLLRNVAVALVRGHAAWALGRIQDERSVDALRARLLVEEDEEVVREIRLSLDEA
jgi:HEAT repeats